MVSFRLGGGDGVAVEAAKWASALGLLGWEVRTVAGEGAVDALLPGLAMDARRAAHRAADVRDALAAADLVIVENLCSLPLNPRGRRCGRRALRRASGRAAPSRPPVAAGRISPTIPRRPTTRPGRT